MKNILNKMRRRNLLDDAAISRAMGLRAQGKSLDESLLQCDGLSEAALLQFLADEFGLPYSDLEDASPDTTLLGRFPARLLMLHRVLPLKENDGLVSIATSTVFDTTGLDALRLATGMAFQPVLAPSTEIQRCLKRCLGLGAETVQSLVTDAAEAGIEVLDESQEDSTDLSDAAEDASIIKFVNQILTEAIERRATDVHIEPFEDRLTVRYRIDGVLQEANIPPQARAFQAAIVSRIKILSHLDIAEKRLPQDGRIKLRVAGREVDVRVSIIPMLHGEAVVLRLLDRSAALLGLENLAMAQRDMALWEHVLHLPHGIILVTGPTGSGKTTTLYAALSHINDVDRKIITIEDPIEYHLAGINQIQVSNKAGLTFARGLRSILRHDPDVILIGEIRDHETAEIAVQASLTGHLVFSTLHTNDAPGALTRLVDMGIEPYLVASSLELILAQRLVRLICPHCKKPIPDLEAWRERAREEDDLPQVLYHGVGCEHCQGTGYHGRRAIFEMMPVTEEIRALILERASAGQVRQEAVRQGMLGLRDDGMRLVRAGLTTVEEVLRVAKDETLNGGPNRRESTVTGGKDNR